MQIIKASAAKTRLLTIALIIFGLMIGIAQAATKMPAFTLSSVKDGALVKSSSYQGQVILINFFATWCPPCRKEIPDFIKLQKEYGARGFTVIGISTDQGGAAQVEKFAQKMEINYPVLLSEAKTPEAFGGIIGIPTSFLVNREGNVVKRYDGYADPQTLANDLKAILK
ncbi:MAG: hypothetical protein A2505_10135 [Deltaproteobacteria bacterium RIFOXYD12_FULL_55_16]|nr:MAG: hypothetical protein A2505_10135 [Deltaproteobacteria bacterium RIFOXYD12_FULL_55_16]